MQVRPGQKFAVIAFEGASVQLTEAVELESGLVVEPAAPVQFDNLWTKWLGTLRAEAAAKANLVITAVMDSKTPDLLDGENEYLVQKVWGLLNGLLFIGVPYYDEGLLFSGANADGVPSIRSVEDLPSFFYAYGERPLVVSATDVQRAYQIYCKLHQLWRTEGQYNRLKRGIRAFLKALTEQQAYYRIHQCCRSIEALILPDKSRTTQQFSQRCQLFATGEGIAQVLKEIYDLRCRVEHLHGFDDLYPDKSREEKDNLFALRARQAEAIARTAYQRVLLDPTLMLAYRDEASIVAFWQQPEQQRRQTWGKPVNIDTV